MSVDRLDLDFTARFGDFTLALKEQLPVAGVTAVFGPSGSGKSSLLRLLAGFERPVSGHIQLEKQVWAGGSPQIFLPPHRRGIGYVFQGGRLLPHLTVRGNLDYADKRARLRLNAYTFEDVITAFDLADLFERKPGTLSGGERQRVALAQALLTRPRLLLLDEPLSALDDRRKQEILPYLEQLQDRFAIPTLYVSHNLREVVRLADRVLMLEAGQATAFGSAVEVLNAHGFRTGGASRSGTILTGKVTRIDERLQLMDIAIGEDVMKLPHDAAYAVGKSVRMVLNASEIALSTKRPEGLSIQNALQGRIKHIHSAPDQAVASVMVTLGTADIAVEVTRAAIEDLDLAPDVPVFALVKTASLAR